MSGSAHHPCFIRLANNADVVKKIHWFSTLSHPKRKLHYRQPERKHSPLNIVLLDTSASTLGKQSLSDAKGAIAQLAEDCYLRREQLCIMTFGNNQIETVLRQRRAPRNIQTFLDNVQAGGGTPLRKALLQVRDIVKKHQQQTCQLFLFTDGRSRESLQNIHFDCDVMIIDTENVDIKLGMSQQLAQQLNGRYVHVQDLQACL